MMRFTGGIATGLAVLVLGPALLPPLRVGLAAKNRQDPASTQQAITEVEEIAAGLRMGSREAALRLLDATEAPILDSAGREARSEALRAEVEALQRRLDASLVRGDTKLGAAPREISHAGAVTTRTALATPRATSTSHASPRIESPEAGYSADPLRQAIACVRAGQHERALDVLARLDKSAAREYWRGKALEALGRAEQALASYDEAAGLAPKSTEGRLARTDAEFLRWRAGLAAPKPGSSEASAPSTAPAAAPAAKEAHP